MQSLPDLSQLSHAQKDEIIRLLWAQLQELKPQMHALQERIKQLEGRLSLNSKNSIKPPATDGYGKPAPKSLRTPGQDPSGGQKGHSGNTLRQTAHVDQAITHTGPSHCSACRLALHQHQVAETRQV